MTRMCSVCENNHSQGPPKAPKLARKHGQKFPEVTQAQSNATDLTDCVVLFINESKTIQSSQVEIRVENKFYITAILDSGSEVNLLSERVYNNLIKSGVRLLSLPVEGVVLVTAFGKRSNRIRQQTLTSFEIEEDTFESVFLISPQLSNQAIIGCQTLKEYGIRLDFKRESISYVRDVLKEYPFSFT
jgi:predicted aspartyl protease